MLASNKSLNKSLKSFLKIIFPRLVIIKGLKIPLGQD